MEVSDIPLSYFLAGFLVWLISFMWFAKHPEWIGASVLVFLFAMPVIVDSMLGGTHIPTGQIIVLFFCPALIVSAVLRRVYVCWNDLLLLSGYGLAIMMSFVANDLSFWPNKSAMVPVIFAIVIYLSVDSQKALYRLLYVYIVLILINTVVAGLQRAGFEWAYPAGHLDVAAAGGFERGFGLAGHFTKASLYATMVVPIAVALFVRSGRPVTWILSFAFAMIGIAGQVFSVSRSGVLGTMAGVFIVLKRGIAPRAVVVGAALVLLGTAIVMTTPVVRQPTDDLIRHLSGVVSDEKAMDESAASRPEWAMIGLNKWLEKPILGGGPHAVVRSGNKDPHNTFVNVLASYGTVGFLLFILIIYRCYRSTLLAARMGYRTEGAALAGALVSTLPIAYFHSVDYFELFWFVPALCLAVTRLPDKRRAVQILPVVSTDTVYALPR